VTAISAWIFDSFNSPIAREFERISPGVAGTWRDKTVRRRSNTSDRERQRRALRRAMSVRVFCETYDIGRTKAYEEINAGRLKARKIGSRTIITTDDAEDWLNALPAINEAVDEAAS
jgi:hypothetical protein